jgi:hypothetical protein
MAATSAVTQPATDSRPSAPLLIATCCVVIILALVLGVGLASNLVVRHLVQTAPLWIGFGLGLRRSKATSSVALPCFLFWLVLMALIWSYLLGISHLISGHFSTIEIAMTIIVGASSLIGIVGSFRSKSILPLIAKLALFLVVAVMQFLCFRISFLPLIANR